ncbi:MAG: FAD-dependent oxidoreductase [Rhodospirillaceae bacterium]|nr:FAD-dependent oxidoreductase [Rhodospirillaceae bacterium]
MTVASSCEIVIIGAGPAGAVAGAILARRGYDVVVLERQVFPRFSIGESLLPQCMAFLGEAGMLDAVFAAQFQHKDGAAFWRFDQHFSFDFCEKFTPGWSSTFQVQRANFDKILADEASRAGCAVHYEHEILAIEFDSEAAVLDYGTPDGKRGQIRAKFCLDASGFGRTLPRLLKLDLPSNFPVRKALFTHVIDRIERPTFDRNKILISVHPKHSDIWFWLIPFSNGTSSLGAVGPMALMDGGPDDNKMLLQKLVVEAKMFGGTLTNAEYHIPVNSIAGYASNVSAMHGPRFALLGNAGEFLDPIFSSGVTIALKSSSLAAGLLDRQLHGDSVDWQNEFAVPLKRGVDTFRQFVTAWYDGRLQDIIFALAPQPDIQRMICSILAGYAWDEANPFVAQPERRLSALAELCRSQPLGKTGS